MSRAGAASFDRTPLQACSAWHFFMKLVFAAPDSFLPSLLTALAAQVSRLHFLTKLILAAP